MKRIAIVETDARGGLIHFAYHMADALAAEGSDVTLVTGSDYELAAQPHRFSARPILKLWPQFDQSSANPLLRRVRRAWRAFVLLREWSRLTLYLLRSKPDVVIFSIVRFPFLAIFLKVLHASGIDLTQLCHEFEKRDETPGFWHRVEDRLFAATYRQFSSIFFLSQNIRDDFLARHAIPARTCLLPHPPQHALLGSDLPVETVQNRLGLSPKDRIVLFFGLLRPSKGVDDLVQAFSLLGDMHHLKLVICGYPSNNFDTRAIQALAEQLGVTSRTVFAFEYLPNDAVAPLLSLAEVVVFPYRNATASGALALAQGLGRPVVATSVSGLTEAIEHGVTGRLAAPGMPQSLAAEIRAVLEDAAAADGMGLAARRLFDEERSWHVLATRLLACLDKRDPQERR
ncbi:hypothetical protein C1J03_15435 [Sulfitobacter sp. SK012]|uniref:glycosyltransferase family 4 protein n=1 Tax=Sulfitobacter sp. SK012 TaxID=1389005 RepID=UPI000E0B0E61|nr:glycosyltransferase family 4 protein [Sulfitobacter sp. SK012]AXI47279.1 hypothetical protein C1J03_15435 [Sulfitobacter sp. SK012]